MGSYTEVREQDIKPMKCYTLYKGLCKFCCTISSRNGSVPWALWKRNNPLCVTGRGLRGEAPYQEDGHTAVHLWALMVQ
jgi:hypothetical protein